MVGPLYQTPANRSRELSGWGATSLALGLLGFFFSWVSPLGFMVSSVGLLCGLVGMATARRVGRSHRLALGGTVLSLLALGVCFFLTAGGFVRWVHQVFLP
jgi:hypothetical protein